MMYFKPKNIDHVVDKINDGQVGVIPFDTVPGLVGLCDPSIAEKIFKLKGRETTNPLLITIPNLEHLSPLISEINDTQKSLIEKYWPGPLSLIFNKSDDVSEKITANLSTIAIRFPSYIPLNILLDKLNKPLLSTSANISGQPSPKTMKEVGKDILEKCGFSLDRFECFHQDESTIIDARDGQIKILREGAIKL